MPPHHSVSQLHTVWCWAASGKWLYYCFSYEDRCPKQPKTALVRALNQSSGGGEAHQRPFRSEGSADSDHGDDYGFYICLCTTKQKWGRFYISGLLNFPDFWKNDNKTIFLCFVLFCFFHTTPSAVLQSCWLVDETNWSTHFVTLGDVPITSAYTKSQSDHLAMHEEKKQHNNTSKLSLFYFNDTIQHNAF